MADKKTFGSISGQQLVLIVILAAAAAYYLYTTRGDQTPSSDPPVPILPSDPTDPEPLSEPELPLEPVKPEVGQTNESGAAATDQNDIELRPVESAGVEVGPSQNAGTGQAGEAKSPVQAATGNQKGERAADADEQTANPENVQDGAGGSAPGPTAETQPTDSEPDVKQSNAADQAMKSGAPANDQGVAGEADASGSVSTGAEGGEDDPAGSDQPQEPNAEPDKSGVPDGEDGRSESTDAGGGPAQNTGTGEANPRSQAATVTQKGVGTAETDERTANPKTVQDGADGSVPDPTAGTQPTGSEPDEEQNDAADQAMKSSTPANDQGVAGEGEAAASGSGATGAEGGEDAPAGFDQQQEPNAEPDKSGVPDGEGGRSGSTDAGDGPSQNAGTGQAGEANPQNQVATVTQKVAGAAETDEHKANPENVQDGADGSIPGPTAGTQPTGSEPDVEQGNAADQAMKSSTPANDQGVAGEGEAAASGSGATGAEGGEDAPAGFDQQQEPNAEPDKSGVPDGEGGRSGSADVEGGPAQNAGTGEAGEANWPNQAATVTQNGAGAAETEEQTANPETEQDGADVSVPDPTAETQPTGSEPDVEQSNAADQAMKSSTPANDQGVAGEGEAAASGSGATGAEGGEDAPAGFDQQQEPNAEPDKSGVPDGEGGRSGSADVGGGPAQNAGTGEAGEANWPNQAATVTQNGAGAAETEEQTANPETEQDGADVSVPDPTAETQPTDSEPDEEQNDAADQAVKSSAPANDQGVAGEGEAAASGSGATGAEGREDAPARSDQPQESDVEPDKSVVPDGEDGRSGSTDVGGGSSQNAGTGEAGEANPRSQAATVTQKGVGTADTPASNSELQSDRADSPQLPPLESPTFDIVRTDNFGITTIAGRAPAGSTVQALVEGSVAGEQTVGRNGQFAMIFGIEPDREAISIDLRALVRGRDPVNSETTVVVVVPPQLNMASLNIPDQIEVELPPPSPAVPVDLPASVEIPLQPSVLLIDREGVSLIQPSIPDPAVRLLVEIISYSSEGEVFIAGRLKSEASSVNIYLNNELVKSEQAGPGGRWWADLVGVEPGIYRLRIEEVDEHGGVLETVEMPFQKEDPARAVGMFEHPASQPDDEESGGAPQEGPVISLLAVQKGFTLWGISRENYGLGRLYVNIFDANRDQIRDPDLIYPGQIFIIPHESKVVDPLGLL